MEGHSAGDKPLTEKRRKILEIAFAQLRKSRAAIDPKVLSKIRRIVASSPDIMKKLGVSDDLNPDQDMPLSNKTKSVEKKSGAPKQTHSVPTAPKNVTSKKAIKKDNEQIDQARNMEVMAKLMALKPSGKDKIKSVIKKAVD